MSDHKRDDSIQSRIDIINGYWPLTDETKAVMNSIRKILSEAANAITTEIEKVPYDNAKLITALDRIQETKDIACVSVILPSRKPSQQMQQ